MLPMIVAKYLVGRNQARSRSTARLGTVAECAVLLKQRSPALGCRFVRHSAQAQKIAQGGGPLLRRHVVSWCGLLLRRSLIYLQALLAAGDFGRGQDAEGEQSNEGPGPHASLRFT